MPFLQRLSEHCHFLEIVREQRLQCGVGCLRQGVQLSHVGLGQALIVRTVKASLRVSREVDRRSLDAKIEPQQ